MNMMVVNDIVKVTAFNDETYHKLINKYGQSDVDSVIRILLREKDEKPSLYIKIIGEGNENCEEIINRFFLPRITEIKELINQDIKWLGIILDRFPLLCDKVDFINVHSRIINDRTGKNLKGKINELYQEFIIVRNRICEYYLYLIDEAMSKYDNGNNYDDVYQNGFIGLLKSIEGYKPDEGSFSKYAYFRIKYEIGDHVHDLDLSLSLSKETKDKYYAFLNVINYYQEKWHRLPTKKEISATLKISLESVNLYYGIYHDFGFPMDDDVIVDGEMVPMVETISDSDDIRDLENMVIHDNLESDLREIMDKLSDKQKQVIEYYYFTDEDKKRFVSLAQIMGISHQGVSYHYTLAMNNLREYKKVLRKYLR